MLHADTWLRSFDPSHFFQASVTQMFYRFSAQRYNIWRYITQSLPGYNFNLIQHYVPIWHNQLQKKQVRCSVFSPKSKIFPQCCLIPERGVHIFIVLFLAACHHLPGTNTVWRFTIDMRRDEPREGQDKVMMWVDVFTLHQSNWVADHLIDISI